MKKIGIGFVGAGWMGATLLKRLAERDDTTIVGLHQRRENAAKAVLQEIGLPGDLYTPNYETLLVDPSVDAVFICSTNAAHGQQAIQALEAGKHVFCEKPCATRFDEFCRQIELARANPHLVTFVDYLMNFDTLEQRLVEMTRRDAFGQISQIQVNYRHPVNIADDKIWKLKREAIGDAIGQGIIHSLSVMLGIMAAQDSHPISVFATEGTIQKRGFEVPPLYHITIQFSSGATGACFGNIDHANGYDAYHNIHGTGGGLIFDSYLDRPSKVRFWSERETAGKWIYPLDPERCTREGTPEQAWPSDTTTPDSGDVMKHQTGACVTHFMDCIHEGKASPWSFENSATTAEIGWAALMSSKQHRPVSIPLDWTEASEFFRDVRL